MGADLQLVRGGIRDSKGVPGKDAEARDDPEIQVAGSSIPPICRKERWKLQTVRRLSRPE